MTIASEISDLQTNLTAAKNAVTAKGGTVGNTGLAGLASEIAGIPSGGGGGGAVPAIARIKYYPFVEPDGVSVVFQRNNNGTYSVLAGSIYPADLQVTIDAQKADAGYEYVGGTPSNLSMVSFEISKKNSNISYDVKAYYVAKNGGGTLEDVCSLGQEYGYFGVTFDFIRSKSTTNILDVNSQGELATSGSRDPMISAILPAAIKEWVVGTSVATAPNFGDSYVNLDTIDLSNASLTSIPSNFCYNAKSLVALNVGSNSASLTSGNALATDDANAASYTTGITLTGSAASAWHTAFPDSNSSPYRKTIVGS